MEAYLSLFENPSKWPIPAFIFGIGTLCYIGTVFLYSNQAFSNRFFTPDSKAPERIRVALSIILKSFLVLLGIFYLENKEWNVAAWIVAIMAFPVLS